MKNTLINPINENTDVEFTKKKLNGFNTPHPKIQKKSGKKLIQKNTSELCGIKFTICWICQIGEIG